MKRKYILAALALIGLGVVTTMAFTLNANEVTVESEVYQVIDNGASGAIDRVTARPVGDLNKIRILVKIDNNQNENYNITIDFIGDVLDLSGDYIYDKDDVTPDASTLSLGFNSITYSNVDFNTNQFWVIIDSTDSVNGDGNYDGTNNVWQDIDSLLITLSDYN
ncbi:hypothetical protein GF326_09370 [Candidatus Bathyarchaeota archaeon]|nr:hypothetical protein [Candidatus Bathyarchaeota archaeon]